MQDNVYEYRQLEVGRVRGKTPHWEMQFVKPDGEFHYAIFPTATMHIRATEFEIPFSDSFDWLIETIMWEPSQPEIQNDERDPGFAAGYNTVLADGVRWAGRLYTAETIQDAREARELRMDWMEQRRWAWDLSGLRKDGGHNRLWRNRKADPAYLTDLVKDIASLRREVRGREDGNPLKG